MYHNYDHQKGYSCFQHNSLKFQQPARRYNTRKGQHRPDTPPYVVRFPIPTAGQGVPSAFKPMRPETVLVAVTPSAPPVENTTFVFSF